MKIKNVLSKLIVLSICFLMMSTNAVKAEDSSISINHVYVTYEESSNVQTSLLSSGLSELGKTDILSEVMEIDGSMMNNLVF